MKSTYGKDAYRRSLLEAYVTKARLVATNEKKEENEKQTVRSLSPSFHRPEDVTHPTVALGSPITRFEVKVRSII